MSLITFSKGKMVTDSEVRDHPFIWGLLGRMGKHWFSNMINQ